MNFDTNKKKGFFKNIKSLYRFQIIDTNTYDVKWVIEISKLNVLVIVSIISTILLVIAFTVFALTPLKFLLPNYVGTKASDKKEVILLKLKVEELEGKIDQYTQYYSNLQKIFLDSMDLHADYILKDDSLQSDKKLSFPDASDAEIKYRKDFEHLLKQDKNDVTASRIYLLNKMTLPAEGTPAPLAPNETSSKTLKIEVKGESGVNTVLSGVVISKTQNGSKQHLMIYHDLGIISSYRFDGKSEVQVGESLVAGQLIGIIGKNDQKILSFDLWEEKTPLAPGQYLKY